MAWRYEDMRDWEKRVLGVVVVVAVICGAVWLNEHDNLISILSPSSSYNDEQNDPDFQRYCRNSIYKSRPGFQGYNGGTERYYNAMKILYARRKWYDKSTNREFFKTLVAAMEIDNLHYQLGIIECYLPIEGKGVIFLWGSNPWKDEFIAALQAKSLNNFVSDGWFLYPPYALSILPK